MSADIVSQKLARLFKNFDIDGNGVIERPDFFRPAAWIAGRLGHHVSSETHLKLQAAYDNMWNHLVPLDADKDGRITPEEWKAGWTQMASGDNFDTTIGKSTAALFDCVDTDADGLVSAEEFANWLCGHGIDRASAIESFKRLDRKGAGSMSKADIKVGVKEFFTSQDPQAPGNWLHGPWQ
jgi:Ca2+-binding EF-hand superfamily protein